MVLLTALLGHAPATAQQLVNGSMDGVANYNNYNGLVPPGWYQTFTGGGGSDIFAPTSTPSGHAWTASNNGGTFVHSYGCSPLYCLSEDVKQTITGLVPGLTYTIKFEQSISNKSSPLMDAAGYWSVTFGGQTLDSDLMFLPPLGQAAPWVPQTLLFTATAITQELTFLAATVDHTSYVHSSLGLDGVAICDCASNNKLPWVDMGNALSGIYGEPCLVGMGPLTPNSPLTLSLSAAKELENTIMVVGYSAINAPLLGGILVPDLPPNGFLLFFLTDAFGQATFNATWPANIPPGVPFHVQAWVQDSTGPQGYSASNAIMGTSQ